MSAFKASLYASVVACLLMAGARPSQAQEPPPAPPEEVPAPAPDAVPPEAAPAQAPVPAVEDPSRTPGGALAFFMASRDYRTLRDLKSVMTPALKAAYDHDSTPFNGKQGIRLAAFDFREPRVNPGARGLIVPVKSLWEDQGEAVELRTESASLERQESGLWRVGRLEKGASESLRYKEPVPGVTALRMILRVWQRRDLEGARSFMSDAFLKRYAGREEGIAAVFSGDPSLKRAAFRILELAPRGSTTAVARVRLVETAPGRPSGLEGTPKTIELVKRGARWLLNDWK